MSTVRNMAKIDCNIKPPHSATWCLLFITSTEWWRLCFHLCWFVSLFVCVFVSFLSVSNITGKHMGRFSSNFQDMLGKIQVAIGKIWRVVCLTISMQGFFLYYFQGNPCLWATLGKNGWTDFHEIFRKGRSWDKEQPQTFVGSCK